MQVVHATVIRWIDKQVPTSTSVSIYTADGVTDSDVSTQVIGTYIKQTGAAAGGDKSNQLQALVDDMSKGYLQVIAATSTTVTPPASWVSPN